MDWEGGRRSDNVDNAPSGAGRPIAVGGGVLGLVGFILYYLLTGTAPPIQQQTASYPQAQQGTPSPAEQREEDFVRVVVASTEDTWAAVLPAQAQRQYVRPRLVVFDGAVESACGFAQAAMGPFYCPPDQQVYLDLSFFEQLASEFQAPGQFAEAYVLAHEVGHHVQNLLGIADRVRAAQERASEAEANRLSVKLELQADCFAGVWAHHADETKHILEQGDVESALRAASAVGDDTLQRRTRGYVVPDSFTHGTSAERVSWFKRGLTYGTIESCDTFSAPT